MSVSKLSRRSLLKLLGTAGAGVAAVRGAADSSVAAQSATQAAAAPKESAALAADRERRMKWWHDARFAMFIHWGASRAWGRHEWAMENEAIPVTEYAQFAKRFAPKPN